MRYFLLILISIFLPGLATAGVTKHQVAGHRVILVAPKGLGTQPAPLVLALHGGTGNAAQMRRSSGLDQLAQHHGFRVAYVDGSPQRPPFGMMVWNAGLCCGAAVSRDDDHVSMLSAVIQTFAPLHAQQPVWIVGHSNGGMMAYRMGCARSDLVDGIVSVAGPFMTEDCRNAQGLQVLHLHGTDDQSVPIEGGVGPGARYKMAYPSVLQTRRRITRAGAQAQVILVRGGTHDYKNMDRQTEVQTGKPIAAWVAQKVAQSQ